MGCIRRLKGGMGCRDGLYEGSHTVKSIKGCMQEEVKISFKI